jgi:hypothetical protein
MYYYLARHNSVRSSIRIEIFSWIRIRNAAFKFGPAPPPPPPSPPHNTSDNTEAYDLSKYLQLIMEVGYVYI